MLTLLLLVTCRKRALEKVRRMLLDVLSQVLLFTMYCCVFFKDKPIKDSRMNNKDVIYLQTLCGGLMELHFLHTVLSFMKVSIIVRKQYRNQGYVSGMKSFFTDVYKGEKNEDQEEIEMDNRGNTPASLPAPPAAWLPAPLQATTTSSRITIITTTSSITTSTTSSITTSTTSSITTSTTSRITTSTTTSHYH
ncbi:uncharacterized protein LOC114666122 [Erpetoichthys calabaricus]|uniref:uncharacterized protein LOC114666122 n=1 Tax=Erpetoichthys calabaricus TaxID=27687 RepID=UPI00109FCA5F|nr:uncharacterized protein LOC114666122 [Erpetoichthys calabaricus]XP_028676692.1 uncharacterized protein LOC114666122 [Erpetoichthys calabaricus]